MTILADGTMWLQAPLAAKIGEEWINWSHLLCKHFGMNVKGMVALTLATETVSIKETNNAFRVRLAAPRCFDDDTTAQAPLAAEGWRSGKQDLANRSITLPLCSPRQIAYRWLQFNSGAMPLSDKLSKSGVAAESCITVNHETSSGGHATYGKAASSKLIWNQHKSSV